MHYGIKVLRVIVLCFLLLGGASQFSYAQKQANWWYFGLHAGLDFTAGAPVGVSNGAIKTTEGCASISDPITGQLQFYTDGSTVWSRNHTTMPNGTGLMGHSSSSHSALVIPFPSNPNRFYLFTVPSSPTTGARYSIVDMTLAGGLGDVVVASKNQPFSPIPVPDKIAAVKHSNGRDYWVVLQHDNTWDLHAYLVNSLGIATTPVVSSVTAPVTGSVGHIGCIKFSPDGSLLATFGANHVLTLAHFDPGSGVFTNIRHNQTIPGTGYGIAFSANSKVLYAANTDDIYQFNTQAGTISQIWNSKVLIKGPGNYNIGQMQLGPDRRIYLAQMNSNQLGVIHFPDQLGLACTFSTNGMTIPGSAQSQYGLPTFVQSFLDVPEFIIHNACEKGFTRISILNPTSVDSILYDFGDTASGAANYSTNPVDSHQYNTAGTYFLQAYAYYTLNGQVVIDTMSEYLHIVPIPVVTVTSDTMVCLGDSVCAQVLNTSAYSILWQDSSSHYCIPIDSAGNYWVEASNECGSSRDSMRVDSIFRNSLNLGPDLPLCPNDTLSIVARDTMATYLWNNGSTDSLIKVFKAGTYSVYTVNQCGAKSDTIRVYDERLPEIDLGPDTAFCSGIWYVLDATWPGASYLWYDGNQNASRHWARTTGNKWVEVSNGCGTVRDSAYIEVHQPLFFNLGPDTVLCEGDSFLLAPFTGHASVLWSNSSTQKSIQVKNPGTWWLQATNLCGTLSDTIFFRSEKKPTVVFPPDTVLCEGEELILELDSPSAAFGWSTGDPGYSITINKPGLYWGKLANHCGFESDSIRVYIDQPLRPSLGADTTLCDNQSFTLGFQFPNHPGYLWNTGERTASILVDTAGIYTVTVSNACGPYTAQRRVEMRFVPKFDLGEDTTLCADDFLTLSTGMTRTELNESEWRWNDRWKSKALTVTESGLYTLEVSNKCGTGLDSIQVDYHASLYSELPTDTSLCDPITLPEFTAEGQPIYWHNRMDMEVSHTGDYLYFLRNDAGCEQKFNMEVKDCPFQFFAPNSFSPNDDLNNPEFRIELIGGYEFHLVVVNRWNEVLFESFDPELGWNGKRGDNQAICPVGAYTWKLEFRNLFNHQLVVETGQVNLLR